MLITILFTIARNGSSPSVHQWMGSWAKVLELYLKVLSQIHALQKAVDTAVQKLLLLFHVCSGRQFVIVSLPLFTNLVWAMCSVPEDKSCWPQPLNNPISPCNDWSNQREWDQFLANETGVEV